LSSLDTEGGVSLFLNGGSGDMSTRFTRKDTKREGEVARFGRILAEAARAAERDERPVDGLSVSTSKSAFSVAYKEYPDADVARKAFEEAEENVSRERERGADSGRLRRLESVREGALVTLLLSGMGGPAAHFGERTMDARVTLARIGGLLIVFFPGEVMSATSLELKQDTREPLMVCGYAEDYFGYLARSTTNHDEETDYESLMTVLDAESIDRLIDGAKKLLRDA
jgi:hypothetical protein